MDSLRLFIIPLPDRLRQLHHIPHRISFQQILIVEMIKEHVQPLLCVDDMRFEIRWGFRLDALHVVAEDFENGLRV